MVATHTHLLEEDMSRERLEAENTELKKENADLQAALLAKDLEINQLKNPKGQHGTPKETNKD